MSNGCNTVELWKELNIFASQSGLGGAVVEGKIFW